MPGAAGQSTVGSLFDSINELVTGLGRTAQSVAEARRSFDETRRPLATRDQRRQTAEDRATRETDRGTAQRGPSNIRRVANFTADFGVQDQLAIILGVGLVGIAAFFLVTRT